MGGSGEGSGLGLLPVSASLTATRTRTPPRRRKLIFCAVSTCWMAASLCKQRESEGPQGPTGGGRGQASALTLQSTAGLGWVVSGLWVPGWFAFSPAAFS